jgi:outer membrane lipopolysaccharide assembly protein LptE/RlpB
VTTLSNRLRWFIAVAGLTVLAGCGSELQPTQPTPNLSGNWSGTMTKQ